jgi:hypothetical protein
MTPIWLGLPVGNLGTQFGEGKMAYERVPPSCHPPQCPAQGC